MFTLPTFEAQVAFALITSEDRISVREVADAELGAADDYPGQPITVAGYPVGPDAGHLIAAGRASYPTQEIPGRRGASPAKWAADNVVQVNPQGRIHADIPQQYAAAQS